MNRVLPYSASEPQQTGVPGIELKRGPEVGGWGQVEPEAREVDGRVGHQEQDGAELRDLVQRADEEAHAWKKIITYI